MKYYIMCLLEHGKRLIITEEKKKGKLKRIVFRRKTDTGRKKETKKEKLKDTLVHFVFHFSIDEPLFFFFIANWLVLVHCNKRLEGNPTPNKRHAIIFLAVIGTFCKNTAPDLSEFRIIFQLFVFAVCEICI